MYKAQNGQCKICGREGTLQGTGESRTTMLVIDHCHTSMQYRGLICYKCNLGLGQFQDSVENLERAINYLKGTL